MSTTSLQRAIRRHPGRYVRAALFYGVLAAFLTSILLPLYYIFLTTFAPGDQVFTTPLTYLPRSLGIERYRTIFDAIPIGRYLLNTLLISTVGAVLSLLVSFLAAYSIARLRFPGADLVLIGLLVSSMLPGVTSFVPLFKMYQRFDLLNTVQGLLLLYVSALLPLTTWILVSFIKQVPIEVEEAARVDGAGFLSLIWQIVLPMILPALATLFLINFIVNWNEFFIPLVFARGEGTKVITMALFEAQALGGGSQYYQNWGNLSAVAILATIPIFAITLLFQRQITAGIMAGAVK
ncbi:MAG: carbohydrate ABC transporter permease [Thermomicrobiales bacterium]